MSDKKTKQYKINTIKQNIPLCLMASPALILMIMFSYMPLFGLILAFKDYTYQKGMFGSAWAGKFGLDNFKYIFTSICTFC